MLLRNTKCFFRRITVATQTTVYCLCLLSSVHFGPSKSSSNDTICSRIRLIPLRNSILCLQWIARRNAEDEWETNVCLCWTTETRPIRILSLSGRMQINFVSAFVCVCVCWLTSSLHIEAKTHRIELNKNAVTCFERAEWMRTMSKRSKTKCKFIFYFGSFRSLLLSRKAKVVDRNRTT